MGTVVSLGSVNLDKVRQVSYEKLEELDDRYDWFPERGQTVQVDGFPADFPTAYDSVYHGGKGANQAVAAAKAGQDVEMLGAVGPEHGEFEVLERLADAGVGVDGVEVAAEATGTAYVFVGPEGDNWIIVRPGANATLDAGYVRDRDDTILSADTLLLQNEVPVAPVETLLSNLASEPDRPAVVLDPAPEEGVETLIECEAVDYVVPNQKEYRSLSGQLETFDGVVVRTRGDDDVVVEGDRQLTVTPPAVETVDTTGAGDVLNGFLGARLAAGDSLPDAVETSTIAASLSTRREGARSGVPTLEDVRRFRASGEMPTRQLSR